MSNVDLTFSLEHRAKDSAARAAIIRTAHSTIRTPVFMPVATHAVIRGQNIDSIADIGFQILLANTYHLLLRPGPELFREVGGIHPFMRWPRSVLTDSGGFQIFSLSRFLKMSEEGAEFRSYVDGKTIFLSPERSIDTQKAIGSDIMMVLDQCIPALSERKQAEEALQLTERWAKRSLAARGDSRQALFGIVQGACYPDLRRLSAEQITALPFDGYALGGFAVGEEKLRRDEMVAFSAELLPTDRPRYLMGVGTPLDLLESVASGVDMFDCILPTALAQQGVCFTARGKMDLRRGVYRASQKPIEEGCECLACKHYTRAYLHHLTKIGEFMGGTLIGIHNLTFYYRLMAEMRRHILADTFAGFYREQRTLLGLADAEHPPVLPQRKSPRIPEVVGDYELVTRGDIHSVRQRSSGEIMHSVTAPDREAEELYIAQSDFRQRVVEHPEKPLVIWDVGLGAGTNAMAAIRAYEALGRDGRVLAPLRMISFERDLDSLRLTLLYPSLFPHVRHAAPHELLRNGTWRSAGGSVDWILQEGDFMQTLSDADAPEYIFFDPFSYKTDSELWTLECFSRVFGRSRPGETSLFTYSASTAVRAALLGAGFYVAHGAGAGPKADTTVALHLLSVGQNNEGRYRLLGKEWLSRWERSDSRYPVGLDPSLQPEFEARIRTHPQFSSL